MIGAYNYTPTVWAEKTFSRAYKLQRNRIFRALTAKYFIDSVGNSKQSEFGTVWRWNGLRRQAPAVPHHQVKVGVIIDGCTQSGVVWYELLTSHLPILVAFGVVGVQKALVNLFKCPLSAAVLWVHHGPVFEWCCNAYLQILTRFLPLCWFTTIIWYT